MSNQIESIPLSDEERKQLRAQRVSPWRMIRDYVLYMPLLLFFVAGVAALPSGLVAAFLALLDHFFDLKLLAHGITRSLLIGLWGMLVLGFAAYGTRESWREYRSRSKQRAPVQSDLAGGVKQCQTLRIDEALCVQEDEHEGLGYFCRLADGRVIFVVDHESQSWEPEDLAAGYRRGVDPRQEKFVPAETLRLCWAPASKFVFDEAFSGARVPLVDGIYWTDVTKLPDSGTFIKKPWAEVVTQYKQDKRRVDWTDAIKQAEEEAAA